MTTRSPSCPQSAPIPDTALCRANLDIEAIPCLHCGVGEWQGQLVAARRKEAVRARKAH